MSTSRIKVQLHLRPVTDHLVHLGEGHAYNGSGTGSAKSLGGAGHRRTGCDHVIDNKHGSSTGRENLVSGLKRQRGSFRCASALLRTPKASKQPCATKVMKIGVPTGETLSRVVATPSTMRR